MSEIFKYVDKNNSTAELITDKNQIKQCHITDDFPKIPKFEKCGICNDAIFQNFSQIDEIVKDIQEKKDNAMAMEFTKCIGELLKKNGVTPKITEYSGISQTDKTFETRYGVSIDELDFSEHDKEFEDKISQLEKDIASYKQTFEDKCSDYKFTSDLLEKFINENEELKQRIAELESKETEKPTKINLNDRVKVKLTPLGAEIYYHQYDEIKGDYPKIEKYLTSKLPRVDNEGYTEFQLHHFIELYGGYIGMSKKNVIEPLDIIVAE